MRVLSRFWRRSHENFAGQFITASRRIRARVVWSIHWREAGAGGRWPDLSCGRTLKTRDWKTQNQISRVENARPPSVEREMDKSKVERNIVWYVYYIIIIMLHFATHAHDVPSFFSPAFSTPGNLVPCFPVLTFPVPRFQSPPWVTVVYYLAIRQGWWQSAVWEPPPTADRQIDSIFNDVLTFFGVMFPHL